MFLQMSVSPEEEELRNGLLCLEGGGALKSIPSSSSVYDLLAFPWLLCSHWLTADRWEEGTEEEGRWRLQEEKTDPSNQNDQLFFY